MTAQQNAQNAQVEQMNAAQNGMKDAGNYGSPGMSIFGIFDILKNLSFSLIEFKSVKPILQAGSSAGNVMLTAGSSVKWVELSKPACQTKIVSFWNEQIFFIKQFKLANLKSENEVEKSSKFWLDVKQLMLAKTIWQTTSWKTTQILPNVDQRWPKLIYSDEFLLFSEQFRY